MIAPDETHAVSVREWIDCLDASEPRLVRRRSDAACAIRATFLRPLDYFGHDCALALTLKGMERQR